MFHVKQIAKLFASRNSSARTEGPVAHVSVYRLHDRWLVLPERKTNSGLMVSSVPIEVLPAAISAFDLGQAALAAFKHSKGTVAHPVDWRGYSKPRLAAAGVKSERAFGLKARLIRVEASAEGYRITPTHNGGTAGVRKGFYALPDQEIFLPPTADQTSVGQALLDALVKCALRQTP